MKHALQAPVSKTAPVQAKPVSATKGILAVPTVADNRPIASIQRKLQQTANESPLVNDPLQLKTSGDAFAEQQTLPMQRVENNTGLPDNLKSGIEHLSGMDMSDVKVHYNSPKPDELQADAYAQGTDIHIAPGQEKHLPHEAWHVVQQKQGRVRPTRQLKGKVPVNDDEGLEKEADEMGSKALQLKASPGAPLRGGSTWPGSVFQLRRQRAPNVAAWNNQLTLRKTLAAANQARLNTLINNGLTTKPQPLTKGKTAHIDTLFRNACEAIRDQKIFITALTQTLSCDWIHPDHTDYSLFSRFWTVSPQEAINGQLFFDRTISYPNTGTPDDQAAEGLVTSNGNYTRRGNEPAHSSGVEMRIFFGSQTNYTDYTLKSIIVHESQHSLDHHDSNQTSNFASQPMMDSRNTPGVGDAANRYQTEFRAYWLGENPNPGHTFGSANKKAKNSRRTMGNTGIQDDFGNFHPNTIPTNFKNERQENIFWYLVDGSYGWVATNYADSEDFRDMVNNYSVPVGGNLLNSSRIEEVFLQLRSAKLQFDSAKKKAENGDVPGAMNILKLWRSRLVTAASKLDLNDRTFLSDRTQSAPFWNFFSSRFEDLGNDGLNNHHQKTRKMMLTQINR